MKGKYAYFICFLVGILVISCATVPVQAGTPKIRVNLKLSKDKLEIGQPVITFVHVKNIGEPLTVNKGFKDMDYHMQMRVISPAGNLLKTRSYDPHIESPDAPPLPYSRFKGRYIRVMDCEELPHGWENGYKEVDLRDYYDLTMPGRYEIQVQLSLMIFDRDGKESPCDINNKKNWLGVLKSPKKYLYIRGPAIKMQAEITDRLKSEFIIGSSTILPDDAVLPADSTMLASLDTSSPHTANKLYASQTPVPLRLDKLYQKPAVPSEDRPLLIQAKSNPGASKASNKVPSAAMITPAQSSDVNPDTEIAIELSKAGKKIVVVVHVMGLEVYHSLSPAQHLQYTRQVGNPPSYTLIYNHQDDSRLDIGPCQHVTVTVTAYNKNEPGNHYNFVFNFRTASSPGIDMDGDCIPNDVEKTDLGTDENKKTLFVLPLIETAPDTYEFWSGFKSDLFPFPAHIADRPGFAYIQPLAEHPDVPIEISIIGDPQHPYTPMRKQECPTNPPDTSDPDYPLNCFYDPAADPHPDGPPCDILVVYYMAVSASCPANVNKGHTFFNGLTWTWDTKGITHNMLGTEHYRKYQYHIAYVYGVPLDNYFRQGAYEIIDSNLSPIPLLSDGTRLFCDSILCTGKRSPMNLNDAETAPPYHQDPDSKVEFNPITFYGDGKVSSAGNRELNDFDRNEVLRRTTLHEMGHALLSAQNSDHCANTTCIMCGWSVDWTLHGFGDTGSCTHSHPLDGSPNGSKDIREAGIIHNSVH